jgi:hypothetical protein
MRRDERIKRKIKIEKDTLETRSSQNSNYYITGIIKTISTNKFNDTNKCHQR